MQKLGMRFLDFVGGPGCKTWKVGQVQPADGGARLRWMYRIHEDFAMRCQFFAAALHLGNVVLELEHWGVFSAPATS